MEGGSTEVDSKFNQPFQKKSGSGDLSNCNSMPSPFGSRSKIICSWWVRTEKNFATSHTQQVPICENEKSIQHSHNAHIFCQK